MESRRSSEHVAAFSDLRPAQKFDSLQADQVFRSTSLAALKSTSEIHLRRYSLCATDTEDEQIFPLKNFKSSSESNISQSTNTGNLACKLKSMAFFWKRRPVEATSPSTSPGSSDGKCALLRSDAKCLTEKAVTVDEIKQRWRSQQIANQAMQARAPNRPWAGWLHRRGSRH